MVLQDEDVDGDDDEEFDDDDDELGGAARAAVVGLADIGVSEIRIVNRTVARAESLADIVADQDVAVAATGAACEYEACGAADCCGE